MHRASVFAVVLAATAGAAPAATFDVLDTGESGAAIVIRGPIERSDTAGFARTYFRATAAGKKITGVMLDSEGGNVAASFEIGDMVREMKMSTFVPGTATCASACFNIFSAGVERGASEGAYIGLHRPSIDGRETVESQSLAIGSVEKLKSYGVSDAIIGKIVTTPAAGITWLKAADLRTMGVVMVAMNPAAAPATMAAAPAPAPARADGALTCSLIDMKGNTIGYGFWGVGSRDGVLREVFVSRNGQELARASTEQKMWKVEGDRTAGFRLVPQDDPSVWIAVGDGNNVSLRRGEKVLATGTCEVK